MSDVATDKPSSLQHPLTSLIPSKEIADDYVSRNIDGQTDIELLRYAHDARIATTIFGPPGPGKTTCVAAYCARYDKPMVTIHCNGAIEPQAAFGQWTRDHDGNLVYQESDAVRVIREGGVLYFDEINYLPPKIASVFYGLLDFRRSITLLDKGGEEIKAHPDLQVVATYNPETEGARPMADAFKDRFEMKLEFDYDVKIEAQVLSGYMPVLLEIATKLRDAWKKGDLETPVTTRMLKRFEEFAHDLGYDFAVRNFLNAFNEHERVAVRDVLELHSARIKQEMLAYAQAAAALIED